MREYDVLYSSRVCIDKSVRAGKWFTLTIKNSIIK